MMMSGCNKQHIDLSNAANYPSKHSERLPNAESKYPVHIKEEPNTDEETEFKFEGKLSHSYKQHDRTLEINSDTLDDEQYRCALSTEHGNVVRIKEEPIMHENSESLKTNLGHSRREYCGIKSGRASIKVIRKTPVQDSTILGKRKYVPNVHEKSTSISPKCEKGDQSGNSIVTMPNSNHGNSSTISYRHNANTQMQHTNTTSSSSSSYTSNDDTDDPWRGKSSKCGRYEYRFKPLRDMARPFTCHVCGYKAAYINNFKVHMRKHTGEKPFKCDLCDHRTTTANNLKTHRQTHQVKFIYKSGKLVPL